MKRIVSFVLMMVLLLSFTLIVPTSTVSAAGQVTTSTLKATTKAQKQLLDDLMEQYTSFIVVKHNQLGASHYAYTEAVSDSYDSDAPNGDETQFKPGSQMILVELEKDGDSVKKTETVLINSSKGVIRDPDVSEDGTKVLFSWKKEEKSDDYHLYEYDLITNETRQLTFGLGVADTDPKYLPNGNIVFSSTRCIQTVDCWKTPVSNLYICGPNGEDIVRVGYDQVHTTYPTVTDDGRVIYTRWDYNDRTQMYVQSLFQMFPDGTNQTELFGNDSNYPTTLLHTRQVAGVSDKYISIASGHHTRQAGSLVMIDTSKGRNSEDAVSFVFPEKTDNTTVKYNSDWNCQDGALYKYPYSISENQFLVACDPTGWDDQNGWEATFNIYLMDTAGNKVELVNGKSISASQIVPVATRTLFERASMVNYASNTGTYYIGNIYEGDGLKGIEVGAAKYLRIVALEFRSYAIGETSAAGTGSSNQYTPISTGNGSWDVKHVLGVVPIEEDGSALFKVPSETPIYFQVLDEDGYVIQSMRSWSTLMPGETFSCVGCHEDKNTVPPAASTTTIAMAKGVQEIQPDLWMTDEDAEDFDPYTSLAEKDGFDYLEEIQPIFDESCVKCHNDLTAAFEQTNAFSVNGANTDLEGVDRGEEVDIISLNSTWEYYKSNNTVPGNWNTVDFTGDWASGKAPFGNTNVNGLVSNTSWADTSFIWIRQEFQIENVEEYAFSAALLNMYYDDRPTVYLNGHEIYSATDWCGGSFVTTRAADIGKYLLEGTNVLAIRCEDTGGNRLIEAEFALEVTQKKTITLVDQQDEGWKYVINSKPADDWTEVDFNSDSWRIGKGGFGAGTGANTAWNGDNSYIWLRKEFTLTASQLEELEKTKLKLSVRYDEDPVVYLNGKQIYLAEGWTSEYQDASFPYSYTGLLKEGKNVLAVQAFNSGGGLFIDAALTAVEFSGDGFSLESVMLGSSRMLKEYPISYLYLTGTVGVENAWTGRSVNPYTNWISSMSQCEMLTPYQFGAINSHLVEILREGHNGVELTDKELRKIQTWIDLGVPCYGDYASGNTWDSNAQRWADECNNKREYYDNMNELARKSRALGTAATEKDISITYKSGRTVYDDVVNFSGAKRLEVPTNYKAGDTITVTMPEGEYYLGLTLDSRMGEAIIYVPNGTYTFTVPSNLQPYNRTFKNSNDKTITARVVGIDEFNERHNLAENPYDLTDLTGSMNVTGYPHATTNSNYGNSGEFIVRNAIDGMAANKGHGSYPTQSWGPDQGAGKWMQIDFGREVYVDEIVLAIRADFPHDTYFNSGTLEFSDGTQIDINIKQTADKQSFTFDPIKTSYVKLTNLIAVDKEGDDWAAITEFEAYGTELGS